MGDKVENYNIDPKLMKIMKMRKAMAGFAPGLMQQKMASDKQLQQYRQFMDLTERVQQSFIDKVKSWKIFGQKEQAMPEMETKPGQSISPQIPPGRNMGMNQFRESDQMNRNAAIGQRPY